METIIKSIMMISMAIMVFVHGGSWVKTYQPDFFNEIDSLKNSRNTLTTNLSFSFPIKINDDIGHNNTMPDIAVDRNGTLYVVWTSDRDGTSDVFFSKSTDSGKSWSKNKRVNSYQPGGQGPPVIKVDDNGTLYIAWYDSRNYPTGADIYFTKSIDGGQTWINDVLVTPQHYAGGQPAIAIDSKVGNIYVVWPDLRNGLLHSDIYFARSTDGGLTWEPDIKVNDDNLPDNDQRRPSIAVDGNGTIYVAWNDERTHPYYVYYTTSINFGKSFSPNKPIGQPYLSSVSGCSPDVDYYNGYFYMWVNGENGTIGGSYLLKTRDNGKTFTPIFIDLKGHIDFDNIGYMHTLIDSSLAGNPGNLSYAFSKDQGMVWSPDSLIRKFTPGLLKDSNVVGFNGIPYIVWSEQVNTDWNIYFTRGIYPNQKESISLEKGWNLISLPLLNQTNKVDTVLSSIAGKYETVKWYDAETREWKIYNPARPDTTQTLKYVDNGMGMWIYMKEKATLNITGYSPPQIPIQLKSGWNLVGFPSNRTNVTVAEVKRLTGADRIQGFDATKQYYLRELDDTETLVKGRGYWVHVNRDAVWTVYWE